MKKTKINFVLILPLVLLSLGFSISSTSDHESSILHEAIKICTFHFAGPGFGTVEGCGPNTIPVELNEGCEGYVAMKIHVTNLSSNPVKGVFYSLPAGVAPIYVRPRIRTGYLAYFRALYLFRIPRLIGQYEW